MSEHEAVKIALFGAAGRMGKEILQQVANYPHLHIAYAFDPHHEGDEIEGLTIEAPPTVLHRDVRGVIDFSAADAVFQNVELAVVRKVPYVCGVTGLSEATQRVLKQSTNEIAVLHSPNMSAGMNLMFQLSALAAKVLPDYSRQIIETHHTRKQDAPSGTALRLADRIRNVTGKETPVTSIRMGDVTGEHVLIFGGPGERLEIVHHADSRAVFAHGALRAAEWILDKEPGFYSMGDVLNLSQ